MLFRSLVGKSDMGARPELFAEEHWVLNLSSPTGTPQGVGPVAAGDRIRIRADHVIAEMVEGLGGHVDDIEAPFDPEPGISKNSSVRLNRRFDMSWRCRIDLPRAML